MSELVKLRAKLALLETEIDLVRLEADERARDFGKSCKRLGDLAEAKSDCMKKIAEALVIEKINQGE